MTKATDIRPINSEVDYEAALERAAALMGPELTQSEEDELEVLFTHIEAHEERHYPMDQPTPAGAIKFHMERLGLKQSDLVPIIGGRAMVSEVLSGKRDLTLKVIRALHVLLDIPADVLTKDGRKLPETPDESARVR